MIKDKDSIFSSLPKFLTTFVGRVVADGVSYSCLSEWFNTLTRNGTYCVVLNPVVSHQVHIHLKPAAQHDSEFFPFNKIYNNNIAVPSLEMIGTKLDERDNMVKMDLWDISHKYHWIGWILKSHILKEINV